MRKAIAITCLSVLIGMTGWSMDGLEFNGDKFPSDWRCNHVEVAISDGVKGLNFNGKDSSIEADVPAGAQFTITAWCAPALPQEGRGAIAGWRGFHRHLFVSPRGYGFNYFTADKREHVLYAGAAVPGRWSFLAVTFDGTERQVRLYLDGKPAAEQSFLGDLMPADRIFFIGCANPKSLTMPGFLHGSVNDVQVYRNVLSAGEIEKIHAREKVRYPNSAARALAARFAYYNCDDVPESEKTGFLKTYPQRFEELKKILTDSRKQTAEIDRASALFQRLSLRFEIADNLARSIADLMHSDAPDNYLRARQGMRELNTFNEYFSDEIANYRNTRRLPEKVFSVKDYGAVGDGKNDDGPAIRRAIAELSRQTGAIRILRFPKGRYSIATAGRFDQNTPGISPFRLDARDRMVLGSDGCHINIVNCENLTLEGEPGAVIEFRNSVIGGIMLYGCTNVNLRGLRLTYLQRSTTQGDILKIDEGRKSLSVKTDPGFPVIDDARFNLSRRVIYQYDPLAKKISGSVNRFSESETLADQTCLIKLKEKLSEGWRAGNKFVVFGRDNVYMLSLRLSKFCTLENITIKNAPCAGFVLATCNAVNLINCEISPADPESIASISADGIHTDNNLIAPFIADCRFIRNADDGFNLYAKGYPLHKIVDGDAIEFFGWSIFKPGDILHFVSSASGQILAERQVKSVEKLPVEVNGKTRSMLRIAVDRPLPPSIKARPYTGFTSKAAMTAVGAKKDGRDDPDIVFNASTYGIGTVVRNTLFDTIRGCGVNIQSPNAMVENNVFQNVSARSVAFGAMLSWNEFPGPHNLVIRNNTIRNTYHGISGNYNSPQEKTLRCRPFYGVAIENNLIENADFPMILNNCDNPVVRNNKIIVEKHP